MKLFFISALLLVMGMTSCIKDYECECVTTHSSGIVLETKTESIKATKRTAQRVCDELETSSGLSTEVCTVK